MSAVVETTVIVDREGDRPSDEGPSQPSRDRSALAWRDHVEDGPPIDERRHRRDQPGVPQEVALAVVAGRLRPSSAAIVEGRRARIARRAMIRRLVGSARSSIPSPRRCGMTGRS
jgi:hypothetical protein